MKKFAKKDYGIELRHDEVMTLPIEFATQLPINRETSSYYNENKTCARKNSSGWAISAKIEADYYVWIEDFTAYHPTYGKIEAKLREYIDVESEEAYQHFIENHPLEIFCYGDI